MRTSLAPTVVGMLPDLTHSFPRMEVAVKPRAFVMAFLPLFNP